MCEEKESQQIIIPVTKDYGFSFDDVQFCIKKLSAAKQNIAYYTSLEAAITKCVDLQVRNIGDISEQDTTDLWALVDRYKRIISEVRPLAIQIATELNKMPPAARALVTHAPKAEEPAEFTDKQREEMLRMVSLG